MKTKKRNRTPHIRILVRGRPLSVDLLVYVAVINPIMAIPQLYLILTTETKGISVLTWVTWLCMSFLWLAYGIKHQLKPIILIQTCWILVDTAVIVALLIKNVS